MAETFTMNEAPANSEILNSDEQDSLAVAESLEQEQGQGEQQLLAGKFKDTQALEQAYVELQKKLGNQSSEETEETSSQEESSTSLLDDLWEQAQANDYSEDTLSQLAKADPNDIAKMYLDYRSKAEADKPQVGMTAEYADSLRNSVGGEQKYNEMLGWAGQNLTDQEIESYDAVMDQGDPAAAYWAVQALSYRYRDANGVEGDLVQGKPPGAGNTFRSQAELVEAMSDPRYDRDPAYRRDLMRRLENSDVSF
jgi:hypothetical protein